MIGIRTGVAMVATGVSLAMGASCAPGVAIASKEPAPGDAPATTEPPCTPEPWPLWEAYAARFVADDGRVVDDLAHHSTSEGQAYGLFHALVAGDRTRFDKILAWARDNLAQGDLTRHLPAWQWAQRDDGTWGVNDPNAASDADLWLAYVLIEAGRLWNVDDYRRQGKALLALIAADEVVELPGFGVMLLPGPHGFVSQRETEPPVSSWRVNPSYLPLPVLRGLATADKDGPWRRLAKNTLTLAMALGVRGLQPDWAGFEQGRGWVSDPVKGALGSYDAIRYYLWAGLLEPDDPAFVTLRAGGQAMLDAYEQLRFVPEFVDALKREQPASKPGPIGFHAAILPFAVAARRPDLVASLKAGIEAQRRGDLYTDKPLYYDQNLLLFAFGHVDGRYAFARSGQLEPRWRTLCAR